MSCTIHATKFKKMYDIAVVDEIQMIDDPEQGHKWTEAILRLLCPEIHLCGEPRAYTIIKELVKQCGDTLEVREYERLSHLTVEDKHIKSFSELREGDCIVAFSRTKCF
jgi:ATP-dependent RNA helicase SUPV3L1/SUV3